MTSPCTLRGFGSYVPERVLTNKDLESIVDTTDEWITSRTGIRQRYMVDQGQKTSDLATQAARNALAQAGLTPSDITHILVATCTPDASSPNTATIVARNLGVTGVMALDCNAACSGFLYGLSLARGLVAAQHSAKVLLIASEALTQRCNWNDRTTCVLFGDGAGATIISNDTAEEGNAQLEDIIVTSDGSLGNLLTIGDAPRAPKIGDPITEDYFIRMQGREVFKHAVRNMTSVCRELLKRNGLSIDDMDIVIPHQANLRIIEAVGDRLGVAPEKVFVNVHNFGNTSAASIPIALADARAQGRIPAGSRVLLTTFGGGFTWGAALLHF